MISTEAIAWIIWGAIAVIIAGRMWINKRNKNNKED